MRSHPKNRGFTILEALVAGSVLLLLLSIIGNVLWTALRISTRQAVRSDLLTQADLAMSSLQKDLRRTSLEGVLIVEPDETSAFVSVHPQSGITVAGQPIYDQETRCYRWSNQKLELFLKGGIARDVTFRPEPAELMARCTPPARRQFTDSTTHFAVFDANTDTIGLDQPLTIEMRLEKLYREDSKPEIVVRRKSVFLMNR